MLNGRYIVGEDGFEYSSYSNGTVLYFKDDKLHREDGPAIEYANGSKCWFINDKRHREDGPAIELANGNKHWYTNDKLHREDGPAIEYADGDKHWYTNGGEYTFEEFWEKFHPYKFEEKSNRLIEID